MPDYIYVQTNGVASLEGFLIYMSLVDSVGFAQGIDTVDLSIVQTTDRSLLPISGLKKDLDFDFQLLDEGTNKGFSVNNVGDLTDLSKITTKEQLLFLLDDVITNNANAFYTVYNEWLDRSFLGLITIDGTATGDSFFNSVAVKARLKSGANILSTITL